MRHAVWLLLLSLGGCVFLPEDIDVKEQRAYNEQYSKARNEVTKKLDTLIGKGAWCGNVRGLERYYSDSDGVHNQKVNQCAVDRYRQGKPFYIYRSNSYKPRSVSVNRYTVTIWIGLTPDGKLTTGYFSHYGYASVKCDQIKIYTSQIPRNRVDIYKPMDVPKGQYLHCKPQLFPGNPYISAKMEADALFGAAWRSFDDLPHY